VLCRGGAGQRHPKSHEARRFAVNIAKLPDLPKRRAVLMNANASGISCTPAVGPALLAHAGSGLADTVNHYPAGATAHTGLRDHAVGLISWRERHCLCGGSERQPEQSKHYCFDHCFLPEVQNAPGVADPATRVLVLAGDDIAVRMNPE
jgi:hypothetical protein